MKKGILKNFCFIVCFLLLSSCVNVEKYRYKSPEVDDTASIKFTHGKNVPGVTISYVEDRCHEAKIIMFKDRPNPTNTYKFVSGKEVGLVFQTGFESYSGGYHRTKYCILNATFIPEPSKEYLFHVNITEDKCTLSGYLLSDEDKASLIPDIKLERKCT